MSNSYGVDKAISDVPNHLKKILDFNMIDLNGEIEEDVESSLEILSNESDNSEEELIREIFGGNKERHCQIFNL